MAFAAEIGVHVERAAEKMRRKGVDLLLLNDIAEPGLGFDSERNAGMLLRPGKPPVSLPEMPKTVMAARLFDELVRMREVIARPTLG